MNHIPRRTMLQRGGMLGAILALNAVSPALAWTMPAALPQSFKAIDAALLSGVSQSNKVDLLMDFVDRIEVIYAWSQFLLDSNADFPGRQVLGPLLRETNYQSGGPAWRKPCWLASAAISNLATSRDLSSIRPMHRVIEGPTLQLILSDH